MTISLFIDGGEGTTGLEIADRLAGRGEFELVRLEGAARKDKHARREALGDADIAILCLPDDAAREAVELAKGAGTRIIDASSAHRTAPGWVYGFAELKPGQREAIANAARLSNPGCYPTGFIALVAPLVARGLLPAGYPFAVHGVSGYSGGGRALIGRYQRGGGEGEAAPPAFRAYGLGLDHKHLAEMKLHSGIERTPIFAPFVVPAYRGMMIDVALDRAFEPAIAPADELRAALAEHYAGSALFSLASPPPPDELLIAPDQEPSDRTILHIFENPGSERVRLVGLMDNLGKGAAGAAVQNLNIMTGIEESAGLRL